MSKHINNSLNNPSSTRIVDDAPWQKAFARSMASFGTWFITEYPKLIFQEQRCHHSKHPLVDTFHVYKATPLRNHLKGATSSACQRGSSALIMFYGQFYISRLIYGNTATPTWWSSGVAGLLGGGVSSLVHTFFEPIKIRHEPITWHVYKTSLWPMMWRHALFDGAFFATSTYIQTQHNHVSNAAQFGIAALAASMVNLTSDLWKTRFLRQLPLLPGRWNPRLKWITVVQGLTFTSFRRQLMMKGLDLGFNWWLTGLLYAFLFANSER